MADYNRTVHTRPAKIEIAACRTRETPLHRGCAGECSLGTHSRRRSRTGGRLSVSKPAHCDASIGKKGVLLLLLLL